LPTSVDLNHMTCFGRKLRSSLADRPRTQSPHCNRPSLSVKTAASDPVFACTPCSASSSILAMGAPFTSIVKEEGRLSIVPVRRIPDNNTRLEGTNVDRSRISKGKTKIRWRLDKAGIR
jgi:hypothetical protein